MSYDIRIRRKTGELVEFRQKALAGLVELTNRALSDYPDDEMFWEGD